MENNKQKKAKIPNIKTYTLEQTFKKNSTKKEFKEAYQEEKDRIRLAQTIRDIRKKKNLTQQALAKKTNMPQSVISRLESGGHSVSVETLSKVLNAMDKKIEIV